MMRFWNSAWAKTIVLFLGLSGLIGCTGRPHPIAAQGISSSLAFIPPLATLTPKAAPPAITPSPVPTVPSTTEPTPGEVSTTAELDLTPEIVLGQNAYTTSLQVSDDTGLSRTVDVHYLLYLPVDYGQDPQMQWPLIIFLHGASERGTDPSVITRYSIPALLTNTLDFPFVVLSPQSPLDEWWSGETDVLGALLDQVQAEYAVDPRRVVLTGQSMGGFGAWAMALKYPARFAAVVPVASGWDYTSEFVPANICDLKNVPIWVS